MDNLNFLIDHALCYCSEEIGRMKFNSLIGLAERERVDEALYDDFETAKAREVLCFSILVPTSGTVILQA